MDIRETFLDLTQRTVPKDEELKLVGPLLPDFLKKDPVGNLYYKIGESEVMFCSHLDTVGFNSQKVTHMFDGNFIRTNGKTILGADDKAGVVIMLEMIERGVPGNYFFFLSEEKGCIGSGKLSKWFTEHPQNEFNNIKKCIAFDRKGYSDILTHMTFQRCCSDGFADALSVELGKYGFKYKKDTTGMYCDSGEFADLYPECTNISVGYFDQHKNHEKQDIVFLEKLADACCKVDWENLPSFRDNTKIEFIDDYYDTDTETAITRSYIKDNPDDPTPSLYNIRSDKIIIDYFLDKKHKSISDVSYVGNDIVDINICKNRVIEELDMIQDYFDENEVEYDGLVWDGFILTVEMDRQDTKLSRTDLLDFLPDLDLSKIDGFRSHLT